MDSPLHLFSTLWSSCVSDAGHPEPGCVIVNPLYNQQKGHTDIIMENGTFRKTGGPNEFGIESGRENAYNGPKVGKGGA